MTPTNLHPPNKAELGRRLAVAARHLVYRERIAPSGPVVASFVRRGPGVVVTFRDITGTLSARGGNPSGFELCGTSQASCRWADSRIDGNTIVLSEAGNATRVRYCWGESPVCTVFDGSGLPAGPFEEAIREDANSELHQRVPQPLRVALLVARQARVRTLVVPEPRSHLGIRNVIDFMVRAGKRSASMIRGM